MSIASCRRKKEQCVWQKRIGSSEEHRRCGKAFCRKALRMARVDCDRCCIDTGSGVFSEQEGVNRL